MPTRKIIQESESKTKKAVEVLHNELKSVRTGRASTGLVENIKADYYGTPTPLKQMATLATPQADTIVIKPFDPASVKEIEKAIRSSDLSIAPVVEGKLIRLNVPPLSEERRTQLAAQAKTDRRNRQKVSIRNITKRCKQAARKKSRKTSLSLRMIWRKARSKSMISPKSTPTRSIQ